ncbi:MAG: FTR1 family iron permease [Dehalococcoidia bacterium]|nr:FTR1 family iron permease [Dehalococcoidia bacterium]
MGESLLITLREGFEAALIVAIVLAAVRKSPDPGQARWVWAGTAAAIALSIVFGIIIHLTIDDLRGEARLRTFAVICIGAAGLLTWMILWMRSHSRHLKAELEGKTLSAMNQSSLALASVAFLAVSREGLETALFLISGTTSNSPQDVVIGGLIGLTLAVVLGVAVYHGSRVFPVRRFFQITGVLIIILAAGLLSRGIMFLQISGDLGTFNNAFYNLTQYEWLTVSTQSGRFLGGIFGWDPRPSIEQVVVYLGFTAGALFLFFREPGPRERDVRPVVTTNSELT